MSHTTSNSHFKKTIVAIAVGVLVAPHASWALDLAQSPPGTVEPYVAPNVVISVDDSGSMDFRLDQENATGATNNLVPTVAAPTVDDPTRKIWRPTDRRMNVLKYALREVFNDTTLLAEGKIRVAWQAMNANNGTPGTLNTGTTAQSNVNSMKSLTTAHRNNLLTFVNNLTPGSSTPSHRMFKNADEYMRLPLHQNGPWASKPGTTGAPYLGCRRNYHIFMTDGRWNGAVSGGSQDSRNVNITLPDGTIYGSTNAAARPPNQLYHDTFSDTLADWSFKSWADRLQPAAGLTGSVTPIAEYDQAPATETIGGVALPKYWNPKYNPASWAHMVTYTIGFSSMAYTWPGAPTIARPTQLVPFGYDGSFPSLVNGTQTWPLLDNENKRSLDLWHAALNGRGRFFAVEQGEDLEKAFRMIIQQINTQNEPDRGSTATSGSNASRNDVGKYVANYVPKEGWRGWVTAETVKPDGTTIPAAGWAGKTTADLLDGPGFNLTTRLILTWNDKNQYGAPFKWTADEVNLSTAQKNFLNLKSDGTNDILGQDRLNYIRGDRAKEGVESPPDYPATKPFRERKSRQGSIINSEVWYVGAPSSNYPRKGYASFTQANKNRLPMIYVGGNDGMLHGFSAADGTEKLAYVPRGVIPAVGRLTDPSFNQNHRYFVDGSAMSGDVDVNGGKDPSDPDYGIYAPDWRTLLVGTLGAGGKGYFVLNITSPGTTVPTPGNFSEANAQQLVVMDKTRHASEPVAAVAVCEDTTATPIAAREACLAAADMGHIFAKPVVDETNSQRTTQIVFMNNNRWAAVMGNGYNSKSERPVLLVQYLDGDKRLLRLVATGTTATGSHTNTTDNGLSAPRLVDINSDGRPDVAYAGDLKGNVWKFLITDMDETKWGVARWGGSADTTSNHTTNGVPLFTAKGGTEGSPNSRTLAQSITAAPTVRANDRKKEIDIGGGNKKLVAVGGMMVAFGTGRNIATDDPQNANKQNLYSVLDNTSYKLIGAKKDRIAVCSSTSDPACSELVKSVDDLPAPVTQSGLVQRQIPVGSVFTRDGHQFWTIDASTTLDWNTHKGWYMDLPETRERLLKPMDFYDSSNMLSVFSQVPAKGSLLDPSVEACEAGSVDKERQFFTLINIMDGKRPSVQILDTNGDGKYNLTSDMGASRVSVTAGSHTMIQRGSIIRLTGKKPDGTDDNLDNQTFPEQSMRPSWRQLR
ncbi:MAG: pilus assembly protein PilY [Comamonadaceae bacterium]|nr:MAG: pilus assembly protein PilY [Comamonadaceae bacterium]